MRWIVGLLSPEGWGVLVGALFGAVGSVIVIMWQRRSEDNAKRTALLELLAVEHAKSEDSIGELGETQLYLPIAVSAPEQLLSRGLLRYDHAKHRPLLVALMHLERAVAVFNQLANASNVASVYPALGANKHPC